MRSVVYHQLALRWVHSFAATISSTLYIACVFVSSSLGSAAGEYECEIYWHSRDTTARPTAPTTQDIAFKGTSNVHPARASAVRDSYITRIDSYELCGEFTQSGLIFSINLVTLNDRRLLETERPMNLWALRALGCSGCNLCLRAWCGTNVVYRPDRFICSDTPSSFGLICRSDVNKWQQTCRSCHHLLF